MKNKVKSICLPTREEINVHNSLDEQTACADFFGKTITQAELLFRENALIYQEDLMFMGPVAFCYYLPAFVRYICGEHSINDSDAISCFIGLVEYRFDRESQMMLTICDELLTACDYVIGEYDRFDVGESIYGDLRLRFASFASKLRAACETANSSDT